jgi:phosphatidylserine/phosphatidylglycerophosphate/cardiolipin synthase-like enzyme
MNHAKAMLIDQREAIVGSHNLDALSFERNIESGVFFNDPHMVAQLSQIIDVWRKESTAFIALPTPHWYNGVLAIVLPFFESVL